MKETALFQFRLAPIEQVIPWGQEQPALHWFGLTDGWFWMRVSDQELFRYSQEIQNDWSQQDPAFIAALPYEDYQVARYWEDLMVMVPAVLSPVPNDLAEKIADAPRWRQWQEASSDWWEKHSDDDSREAHEIAMTWWNRRTWSAWHLNHPPNVWLWTVGDSVHIRWDNRGIHSDGIPVWEATHREFVLPISAFREQVLSFDRRLMAAMAERVIQVRHGALDPKIAIDVEVLEREQGDRSQWMRRAIDHRAEYFSWEEVRTAMTAISP